MSIAEWQILVARWCGSRQEVLEPMQEILDWFSTAPQDQILTVGQYKVPVIVHPSASRTWKSTFIRMAASCINYALTDKFRDILTWLSWMSGSTLYQEPKKTRLPESLGLR
jgi:hypothetical protein